MNNREKNYKDKDKDEDQKRHPEEKDKDRHGGKGRKGNKNPNEWGHSNETRPRHENHLNINKRGQSISQSKSPVRATKPPGNQVQSHLRTQNNKEEETRENPSWNKKVKGKVKKNKLKLPSRHYSSSSKPKNSSRREAEAGRGRIATREDVIQALEEQRRRHELKEQEEQRKKEIYVSRKVIEGDEEESLGEPKNTKQYIEKEERITMSLCRRSESHLAVGEEIQIDENRKVGSLLSAKRYYYDSHTKRYYRKSTPSSSMMTLSKKEADLQHMEFLDRSRKGNKGEKSIFGQQNRRVDDDLMQEERESGRQQVRKKDWTNSVSPSFTDKWLFFSVPTINAFSGNYSYPFLKLWSMDNLLSPFFDMGKYHAYEEVNVSRNVSYSPNSSLALSTIDSDAMPYFSIRSNSPNIYTNTIAFDSDNDNQLLICIKRSNKISPFTNTLSVNNDEGNFELCIQSINFMDQILRRKLRIRLVLPILDTVYMTSCSKIHYLKTSTPPTGFVGVFFSITLGNHATNSSGQFRYSNVFFTRHVIPFVGWRKKTTTTLKKKKKRSHNKKRKQDLDMKNLVEETKERDDVNSPYFLLLPTRENMASFPFQGGDFHIADGHMVNNFDFHVNTDASWGLPLSTCQFRLRKELHFTCCSILQTTPSYLLCKVFQQNDNDSKSCYMSRNSLYTSIILGGTRGIPVTLITLPLRDIGLMNSSSFYGSVNSRSKHFATFSSDVTACTFLSPHFIVVGLRNGNIYLIDTRKQEDQYKRGEIKLPTKEQHKGKSSKGMSNTSKVGEFSPFQSPVMQFTTFENDFFLLACDQMGKIHLFDTRNVSTEGWLFKKAIMKSFNTEAEAEAVRHSTISNNRPISGVKYDTSPTLTLPKNGFATYEKNLLFYKSLFHKDYFKLVNILSNEVLWSGPLSKDLDDERAIQNVRLGKHLINPVNQEDKARSVLLLDCFQLASASASTSTSAPDFDSKEQIEIQPRKEKSEEIGFVQSEEAFLCLPTHPKQVEHNNITTTNIIENGIVFSCLLHLYRETEIRGKTKVDTQDIKTMNFAT